MFYGYHFTTLENWKKIQKIGYIKPYQIKNDTIDLPFDVKGIWLWERLLDQGELLGCCIYQFLKKGALQFILLKIPYIEKEDSILFAEPGKYYCLKHKYVNVPLNLHKNVPAIIKLKATSIASLFIEEEINLLDCIPKRIIPHEIGE